MSKFACQHYSSCSNRLPPRTATCLVDALRLAAYPPRNADAVKADADVDDDDNEVAAVGGANAAAAWAGASAPPPLAPDALTTGCGCVIAALCADVASRPVRVTRPNPIVGGTNSLSVPMFRLCSAAKNVSGFGTTAGDKIGTRCVVYGNNPFAFLYNILILTLSRITLTFINGTVWPPKAGNVKPMWL